LLSKASDEITRSLESDRDYRKPNHRVANAKNEVNSFETNL